MSAANASAISELELKTLLDAVLAQAQHHRQRRCIVLSGGAQWCHDLAKRIVNLSQLVRVTWVSSKAPTISDAVSVGSAKKMLGQERDGIVFDAYAGFDPDAFGAVSGTIVAGGLLLLLCPPMQRWEAFADPAAERIAVWPHSFDSISGRFIQRIAKIMTTSSSLATLIEQGAILPVAHAPVLSHTAIETTNELFRTDDQRRAVTAIEHMMKEPEPQPVVLVADRGRGKTTALGIAAARLLQTHSTRIVVTAPRPAAVQPLFEQAQKMLPQAIVGNHCLQWREGGIEFVAPDALCLSDVPADLLLVDEAAAIPVTLLQPLLARYPHIVFSTTIHGYEGTGRGFTVRFKKNLDEQAPGWQEITLRTPIRWANDDPVEALVFKTLLLNANSADAKMVAKASVENVVIEKLDRDALAENETLLSQVFGLLVVAHYRTRPNDLRNLLDGPGLSVYVSRYKGQVVATAMVAREGGFDAQIIDAIYAGKRRPRGHLLPQSLVTHVGLKDAGGLHCERVMRIAVHPVAQGKGLGTQLLQYIKADAQKQGADLFGASFGATEPLLKFWSELKVQPVRMGFRRGHSSGEYSVLVLASTSAEGEKIYEAARARFIRDLPQWLADPLRELDPAVAACLLQTTDTDAGCVLPTNHEQAMLLSFAQGERTYEDALSPIRRLLSVREGQLSGSQKGVEDNILYAKVVQKQSWSEVAQRFGLAGKAEVVKHLRKEVAQILLPGKVTN